MSIVLSIVSIVLSIVPIVLSIVSIVLSIVSIVLSTVSIVLSIVARVSRHLFLNVLSIVPLYSKCARALTFENGCLGGV